MFDLSDPLVLIASVAAVAILIWFAVGTTWNLKRGNDTLRWLRAALPALGEKTTLQWLGTSVVRLNIAKAKAPFKEIEVLIVLEPRDVPVFWLHGYLNGRRDTLMFRGLLSNPPAFDAELMNPQLWTGREALSRINQGDWIKVPLNQEGGDALVALTSDAQSASRVQDWHARSSRLTPAIARISVRRSAVHQLQWHGRVPPLKSTSSAELIHLLRRIAEEAARPRK